MKSWVRFTMKGFVMRWLSQTVDVLKSDVSSRTAECCSDYTAHSVYCSTLCWCQKFESELGTARRHVRACDIIITCSGVQSLDEAQGQLLDISRLHSHISILIFGFDSPAILMPSGSKQSRHPSPSARHSWCPLLMKVGEHLFVTSQARHYRMASVFAYRWKLAIINRHFTRSPVCGDVCVRLSVKDGELYS